MGHCVRIICQLLGIFYRWYLRVPRFDVQRRSSPRYRKAMGICKNIWVASSCVMLVLIQVFPASAVTTSLILTLLTTCFCYMILDEIE